MGEHATNDDVMSVFRGGSIYQDSIGLGGGDLEMRSTLRAKRAAAEADARKRRGRRILVVVASLVAAELIVAIVWFFLLGGTAGGSLARRLGGKAPPSVELAVGPGRGFESLGGAGPYVRCKVHAVVAEDDAKEVRKVLRDHEARVEQAVQQVLRQSHSENLRDPELRVLQRQLRGAVNGVLGSAADKIKDLTLTDFYYDPEGA